MKKISFIHYYVLAVVLCLTGDAIALSCFLVKVKTIRALLAVFGG